MAKSSLLGSDIDLANAPSMKWVKGELHDNLDPAKVDPRQLLLPGNGNGPFASLEWFQRVASHRNDADVPLVAHAFNEGQYCWLFLTRNRHGGAEALANWYSLASGPVFSGGEEPALLTAIARRMAKARSVPPVITMAPVSRRSGASDMVCASFRKGGWIAMRHQSSTSWIAHVGGKSFDDYWAARPGQLRNTFKRKGAKSDITTETLVHFSEENWADYVSVYEESWKEAEGDPAFLKDWAQAEAERGQLRLGLARLNGQVVAAQFWTVESGTAYIHKLAHREEFRELSPGTILSVALFRHVIDQDKVDTIDFGTGNDRYKADWMDESAPLDTIRLFRKASVTGLFAAARAKISALVNKTVLA
jgi:Acetyltransferase (GNAT) domain